MTPYSVENFVAANDVTRPLGKVDQYLHHFRMNVTSAAGPSDFAC